MWHAWDRREKCTMFWWGKSEGKRPLGRPRRRLKDGNRMDVREIGGWIGFDWLRISTGGRLF
jgi:hypothetical protein